MILLFLAADILVRRVFRIRRAKSGVVSSSNHHPVVCRRAGHGLTMDVLFQLPVIGVVFQLVGYLVDITPGPSIVRAATPIALGALCGLMCERSGIVNIGIEGLMLLAAFFAFPAAGSSPSRCRRRRPAPSSVSRRRSS